MRDDGIWPPLLVLVLMLVLLWACLSRQEGRIEQPMGSYDRPVESWVVDDAAQARRDFVVYDRPAE